MGCTMHPAWGHRIQPMRCDKGAVETVAQGKHVSYQSMVGIHAHSCIMRSKVWLTRFKKSSPAPRL